jgi:hypothetical protein
MAQAVSSRPLTAEVRVGLAPGSVHVGFVMDKVALEQALPRVLLFSPVSTIHHCFLLIHHGIMRSAIAQTKQHIIIPSVLR